MAELNFQFENKGRIPTDIKKTLGDLEVLKVLEPRMAFENNEPTGEIIERPVEVLSSAVGGSVVIAFEPQVDLTGLQTFDGIELTDDQVDVVAWANIDPNAFGNFADSDVKIKASGFKKVTGAKPTATPEPKKENK